MRQEEKLTAWEKTMERADPIAGFKIRFLRGNENQTIQKVEVRNVNFQDIMRHMWRGESVLITPKLLNKPAANSKKDRNQVKWYFSHM